MKENVFDGDRWRLSLGTWGTLEVRGSEVPLKNCVQIHYAQHLVFESLGWLGSRKWRVIKGGS